MKWKNTEDRLPEYGRPVLLKINGVIQHITYCLDGYSDVPDWFEPYFFGANTDPENLSFWWNKAESWVYVDEIEG